MTTHTENLRKAARQLNDVTEAMKGLQATVKSLAPILDQIGQQLQQEAAQPAAAPIQSPMDLIQAFKRLSENPNPASKQRLTSQPLPVVTTPNEALKAAAAAASFVNVQTIPGRNLTDQARHLLRNGHSYNDAIQLLQLAHPSKTREHVRRAAGRARTTK